MKSTDSPTYRDNWLDRLCIGLFSWKMSSALGKRSPMKGYDGFVDLSRQIMRGRNPQQQQALVEVVLKSLVPSPVLAGIRTFFSPTPLVCELNAWFATRLFEWLVGPCEVRPVEVKTANGNLKIQRSGVHIQKCRYLEQSGCVGMCVNMCKLPTQDFFTRDFGIPLTMTPNFEDLSCEMVFGQNPPPLIEEPSYHQSCLANQCPTAQLNLEPCPKVRET